MFSAYMLHGVPPVMFWTFVGAAVVIQGVSKSGFGGGAGIFGLLLMLLVMEVDKVAATLLPLLILCDMNAIYHHRRNVNWVKLRAIYLPAIAGIVLGALVWWKLGQDQVATYKNYIKCFVGVIGIVFGLYILAKDRSLKWVEHHHAGAKTALVAGVAAGFTSTIAHAAGPIVSLFIFSQGLGKSFFVGTVAWTFAFINLTKLPFYVYVGLIDTHVLFFGACLVWLIPIGSWLGKWMHHRIPEIWFNRVIMALTLVSSVHVIWKTGVLQRLW